MTSTLRRIGAKWPEMLLLGVFAVLLCVWNVSATAGMGLLAVAGVVLAVYDHELTWHYSARAARAAQELVLEIVAVLALSVALALMGVDALTGAVMLAGALVVVTAVNDTLVHRAFVVALRDVRARPGEGVLILIVVALMGLWSFSDETILFTTLFLAFFVYKWDSRIPASGALVSLASCPVLLIAGMNDMADQMAVYAYLFLVVTVALQIVEYWREQKNTVVS